MEQQHYIYFLLRDSTVVYIGQTQNLTVRLKQHSNKDWDSVRSIPCHSNTLNYYEKRWIKLFRPKYNKEHVVPIIRTRNNTLIHEGFKITPIAYKYYAKLGKNYNESQARKQFAQDKKINKTVLSQIIDEIYNESIKPTL